MTVTEPEILSIRREGDVARLSLRIPVNLSYFRGHFQQVPLLPGVVQLDWAIRLARQEFRMPDHFKRLSALKFMRVMSPGSEAGLVLDWDAKEYELSFHYASADAAYTYSSGRILFESA